jgi:plastocyanin domain-containing protein
MEPTSKIQEYRAKMQKHKEALLDLQQQVQLQGETPELKAAAQAKLIEVLNEFGKIDLNQIIR